MAWTSPMTAVAGVALTFTQWNTHVRDNMLETMPALATAANRMYCSTGTFDLAERVPSSTVVATAEATASTSYVGLATAMTVTVTTGTRAMCFYNAKMSTNTGDAFSACAPALTAGSSIAASDTWAAIVDGVSATRANRIGNFHLFDTLTAGSNTFTLQFRVGSGTCTFSNRSIIVIPL